MISVLHIGLPLTSPWLTPSECDEIGHRLRGIHQRMAAAGYRYVVAHASPDEGLAGFREQLRTLPWHVVLIGGGVTADPNLASFKQQIIDAVHDEAPQARLLEFNHAIDVPVLVAHALRSS